MSRFPSVEWCRELLVEAQKEPESADAAREWGGRSIGVVLTAGGGLARDFCVYGKPHSSRPELLELKECEDEDDLELEEPDYFFRLPFALAERLLKGEVDPLALLRAGEIKAEGDLKFLIPFGQKWQSLGHRIAQRLASR